MRPDAHNSSEPTPRRKLWGLRVLSRAFVAVAGGRVSPTDLRGTMTHQENDNQLLATTAKAPVGSPARWAGRVGPCKCIQSACRAEDGLVVLAARASGPAARAEAFPLCARGSCSEPQTLQFWHWNARNKCGARLCTPPHSLASLKTHPLQPSNHTRGSLLSLLASSSDHDLLGLLLCAAEVGPRTCETLSLPSCPSPTTSSAFL